MKKIFVLLALGIWPLALLYPQSRTFIRNFGDDIFNLVPYGDSAFYTISVHPGCGKNNYTLRYLNRGGEVLGAWDAPLMPDHLYVLEGLTDASGRLALMYYTLGANHLLYITPSGNILWGLRLNENGYKFHRIVQSGGNYYLLGNRTTPLAIDSCRAAVCRVSGGGTVEWIKEFRTPAYEHTQFNDILVRNDSLLIGGAYGNDDGPGKWYSFLGIMDLDGNMHRSVIYSEDTTQFMAQNKRYQVMNMQMATDGSIYLHQRATFAIEALMKIDANLSPVWTRKLNGTILDMERTYEDDLLISADGGYGAALFRVNSSGSTSGYTSADLSAADSETAQASKIYRFSCGYLVVAWQNWPNDLYLHTDAQARYCNVNPESVFEPLLSTDANPLRLPAQLLANSVPVQQFPLSYALNDTSQQLITYCEPVNACADGVSVEPSGTGSINLYPNPADAYIRLELPGDLQTGTVYIYDINGRCVSESPLAKQISTDMLPAGAYLLRCGKYTGRFIKK